MEKVTAVSQIGPGDQQTARAGSDLAAICWVWPACALQQAVRYHSVTFASSQGSTRVNHKEFGFSFKRCSCAAADGGSCQPPKASAACCRVLPYLQRLERLTKTLGSDS